MVQVPPPAFAPYIHYNNTKLDPRVKIYYGHLFGSEGLIPRATRANEWMRNLEVNPSRSNMFVEYTKYARHI